MTTLPHRSVFAAAAEVLRSPPPSLFACALVVAVSLLSLYVQVLHRSIENGRVLREFQLNSGIDTGNGSRRATPAKGAGSVVPVAMAQAAAR
jgi:hypothetical protein